VYVVYSYIVTHDVQYAYSSPVYYITSIINKNTSSYCNTRGAGIILAKYYIYIYIYIYILTLATSVWILLIE